MIRSKKKKKADGNTPRTTTVVEVAGKKTHLEPAVLYQPLVTEAGEGETGGSSIVPSCERSALSNCHGRREASGTRMEGG
jgi:hypothetical protein